MFKQVLPFAALLAIAACSGAAVIGPAGDDGGGGGGGVDPATSTVPAALKVNLDAVDFDGTTMKVTIAGADSTPTEVTYLREPTLDSANYRAYRMQEDSLDRIFVALGAISDDGSVAAVTVGDGGLNNTYSAGGSYSRSGAFQRPTVNTGPARGQVTYAGSYISVTNLDATRGTATDVAIPVAGSVDPSLVPAQPARSSGDISLTANFADNLVFGSIYNRQLLDQGAAVAMPTLALVQTTIADDGTFAGATEYDGSPGATNGSYGGIFGGTDANSVAGLVHLTEIRHLPGEQEHGVFVLTQCGPNNTGSICPNVAP